MFMMPLVDFFRSTRAAVSWGHRLFVVGRERATPTGHIAGYGPFYCRESRNFYIPPVIDAPANVVTTSEFRKDIGSGTQKTTIMGLNVYSRLSFRYKARV